MTTSRQELLSYVKNHIPKMNERAKNEVDGYYRVPDIRGYVNHHFSCLNSGRGGGNCFYANFELYKQLYKTNKNVKLYMFHIRDRGRSKGYMTHMLVVDGDVYYDNSQFRVIKNCLKLYLYNNEVFSHYPVKHSPKLYDLTRNQWTDIITIIQNIQNIGWIDGSLPITKSSKGLAVEKLFK